MANPTLIPDSVLREARGRQACVSEAGEAPATDRHDALPPGTRLNEFELMQVLGAGGFGIVYLALDHALLRHVAIKEYMPSEMARRAENSKVSVRSASHAETYATGLQSFIKEAQLLASFDHPSLVKVHRFWEANDTAYMVMQYYPGRTLKEERRAMEGQPDETWLRRVVDPILGALEMLHAQGVYHRDISPDNILLLPQGCPVLLDFGAARRVIGERTQMLTAVFKPNFAPIEQYGDVPSMRQGPWTDLYALGAVVHFMLTAKPPVPAGIRSIHDHLLALSVPGAPVAGLSASFLGAIDWALAVRPDERPQNAQTLRDALDGIVMPPPLGPRLSEEEPPNPGTDPEAESSGPWPATMRIDSRPTRQAPPLEPDTRGVARTASRLADEATSPKPRKARHRGIQAFVVLFLCATGFGVWGLGARLTKNADIRADTAAAQAASGVAAALTIEFAATRPPTPASSEAEGSDRKPVTPTQESPPTAVVAPADHSASAYRRIVTAARTTLPAAPQASMPRRASPVSTAPAAAVLTPAQQPPSPRLACGDDRNFLSMAVCMSRECREPRFQKHRQCLEFKRYDEARRQAEMHR